ncbi:MAG: DUF1552 domain-containing protein [Bryobacterales bacterium]|nr:DUF1552 domain-containing protein [Bryobacterales bacterium]
MIRRVQLSRRTLLRGIGTTVALPFLDAMNPAFSATPSRLGNRIPVRMAFSYVPNGIIMEDWTPAAAGALKALPTILEPISEFRDDVMLLSGLTHNNGRALGDGPGDHARAAASFLTGVHPKKTDGADIRNGISVDQVAAELVGGRTRFASIELGVEHGRLAGNCDSGYSCAYSNSISWRSETTPMPPEVNPRLVFERLFGRPGDSDDPVARAKRKRYEKSILDFVQQDTRKLQSELGPTDRRKLDEYLTGVREIEKRIEAGEASAAQTTPSMDRPSGVPVDYAEHAKLMFDLQVVAFQTDQTRIATFMLAREGSNRTYREIGVPGGHHGLTHHRNDEEKIRKISKINRYHMELFSYFLKRLDSIQEGDGTLLDHSMVLYGSGLADGNKHTHHDLPVLVAGRAAGGLHPGRHMRYDTETPMANLYLTLLDRMGVHPEVIGDSNGRLEHLTDI